MRRLAAFVLIGLLFSPPVAAQDDAPTESEAVRQARETARPLATKGFEAYERKAYDEALSYFREAEAIFHAPVHTLYIARSLRAQGQPLRAHAAYRQVVEEKLASYAPVAFLEAQADAKSEMAALEAELAAIEVEAHPEAEVSVDGDATDTSVPVFVLPGEHEVVAKVPWVPKPQRRRLALQPGVREAVTFNFPARPTPADNDPERPLFVPALITLGFGGAALVAGAATGIVHLQDVNDIRSRCIDDRCPPSEEGPANDTTTIGHVSTAMFVVGGLAAAVGTTLLVLDLTADDAPVAHARLSLGVGSVALKTRF